MPRPVEFWIVPPEKSPPVDTLPPPVICRPPVDPVPLRTMPFVPPLALMAWKMTF